MTCKRYLYCSCCNKGLSYAGIEAKKQGYPRPGDIAVLHLSPPCQSLSGANRTASVERIEEELYPILDDVRLPESSQSDF